MHGVTDEFIGEELKFLMASISPEVGGGVMS